jgi:AcrR family transcriptional regulator
VTTARASSRRALVDAALAEFSERGYEASTVADIAARAGVTTGAIYAHFESKLDLLVEAIGLASPDEYADALVQALEVPGGALPLPDGSDRRLHLLLDVVVLARRDPAVAAALRRGFGAYLASMTQAAEVGVALGFVDPLVPPAELTRLGVTISLGVLVLEAMGEPPPEPATFATVVAALLGGGAGRDSDPDLARVRARAAALESARDALHDAVHDAAEAGNSLRRIGEAAGLSHEQVRRLLAMRQKM